MVRCDATERERFFGDECLDSDLDSRLKFDAQGNVVTSFGGGMFIWPHGIDVDREGNIYVTDAVAQARIPYRATQGGSISNSGSASGLGTNFCERPYWLSPPIRLPSESTVKVCTSR